MTAAGNHSIGFFAVQLVKSFYPATVAAVALSLFAGIPVKASNLTISVTNNAGNPLTGPELAAFNVVAQTYQNLFSNPVTINIQVQLGVTGLGASNTSIISVPYTTWRSALAANSAANPGNTFEAQAVASLSPTINPLPGSNVIVRAADAKALAIPFIPATFDSTITFSNAVTFELNNTATPGAYDFQDVAAHELDEALGIGSTLTGLANNAALPANNFEAEDFFRYGVAGGPRLESTNPLANVFFSTDGTVLGTQFNQDNGNGDRNDWILHGPPLVQDYARGTGTATPIGTAPETTVLQTLGYDSAVPEPATMLLAGGALLCFGLFRMRRA